VADRTTETDKLRRGTIMHRHTLGGALALSALLMAVANVASAEDMGTSANVVENFPNGEDGAQLLLAENAHIERRDDGVTLSLRLDTPEAGSYVYPETIGTERQAQPEAFTGWAFVFNHPELCQTPYQCGPADFNEQVKAGVYNFAGTTNQLSQTSGGEIQLNALADGYVVLKGDVVSGQPQLPMPPDAVTFPLENPLGAEIHAAIAPHGQLDPSTLPGELYSPTGNPTCGCWWVAIFQSPDAE
jgi:hypothetical protein